MIKWKVYMFHDGFRELQQFCKDQLLTFTVATLIPSQEIVFMQLYINSILCYTFC